MLLLLLFLRFKCCQMLHGAFRYDHEQWALFHEESPKNNYLLSHEESLNLFNFTATFKMASDFPLTSQYIESLSMITSKKFFQSTARLAMYLFYKYRPTHKIRGDQSLWLLPVQLTLMGQFGHIKCH